MAIYQFEYHTFLHHSQTDELALGGYKRFEYHTFLHHSQTMFSASRADKKFEYHTFLHHSQTATKELWGKTGLSTIHFYIILKQGA